MPAAGDELALAAAAEMTTEEAADLALSVAEARRPEARTSP
jgi:hypothetical protein